MTEEIGLMLGKALFGVSDSDFTKAATFVDTLHSDPRGSFHRQSARQAASLYESAGRKDLVGYHVYTKLASRAGRWPAAFTDLVIPFYTVLGRRAMEKSAGLGGASLGALLGALAGAGASSLTGPGLEEPFTGPRGLRSPLNPDSTGLDMLKDLVRNQLDLQAFNADPYRGFRRGSAAAGLGAGLGGLIGHFAQEGKKRKLSDEEHEAKLEKDRRYDEIFRRDGREAALRAWYDDQPQHKKQASGWATAGGLLKDVVSKYPTLVGVAALLGAGGGALSWQAGQEGAEDDEDAVRMQAQMRYLNDVTNEIDADLRRRARLQ